MVVVTQSAEEAELVWVAPLVHHSTVADVWLKLTSLWQERWYPKLLQSTKNRSNNKNLSLSSVKNSDLKKPKQLHLPQDWEGTKKSRIEVIFRMSPVLVLSTRWVGIRRVLPFGFFAWDYYFLLAYRKMQFLYDCIWNRRDEKAYKNRCSVASIVRAFSWHPDSWASVLLRWAFLCGQQIFSNTLWECCYSTYPVKLFHRTTLYIIHLLYTTASQLLLVR